MILINAKIDSLTVNRVEYTFVNMSEMKFMAGSD